MNSSKVELLLPSKYRTGRKMSDATINSEEGLRAEASSDDGALSSPEHPSATSIVRPGIGLGVPRDDMYKNTGASIE
jgi:hypothetical protein